MRAQTKEDTPQSNATAATRRSTAAETPVGRSSRNRSSIVGGKKRAASESPDNAPAASKKTRSSTGGRKRDNSASDDEGEAPTTARITRSSIGGQRVVKRDRSDSSSEARTSSKTARKSRIDSGPGKKNGDAPKKEDKKEKVAISADADNKTRASRTTERATVPRTPLRTRGKGEEKSEGESVAPRSSRRLRDASESVDGSRTTRSRATTRVSPIKRAPSSMLVDEDDESTADSNVSAPRRSSRRSTAAAAAADDSDEEEAGSTASRAVSRPAAAAAADMVRKLEATLMAALSEQPFITGGGSAVVDALAPAKIFKSDDLPGMIVWTREMYEEKFVIPRGRDAAERFAGREIDRIVGFVKHATTPYMLVKVGTKKNEDRPKLSDVVLGVHTHLASLVMPKAFADYSCRMAMLGDATQQPQQSRDTTGTTDRGGRRRN